MGTPPLTLKPFLLVWFLFIQYLSALSDHLWAIQIPLDAGVPSVHAISTPKAFPGLVFCLPPPTLGALGAFYQYKLLLVQLWINLPQSQQYHPCVPSLV